MYVCVFVGMNVWMWCICDTCTCVQFCIQEWVCRCKGQTRRSGVHLSASLPYSLEIVTPTNPEDRQAARNLSGPTPQQHGVRWSPNHTHFYRSSGSLNSCPHTHSKSVPSHCHPPSPKGSVLSTVLDVLKIIFWLLSSENVTRQCIVIEVYGRRNCSSMVSENHPEKEGGARSYISFKGIPTMTLPLNKPHLLSISPFPSSTMVWDYTFEM